MEENLTSTGNPRSGKLNEDWRKHFRKRVWKESKVLRPFDRSKSRYQLGGRIYWQCFEVGVSGEINVLVG